MKSIYLAGGCFWGLQKFFDQFDGIVHTEAGYANGPAAEPSYRDVCAGSGHAETVRIDYDEGRMDLEKLLEYYFPVIVEPPGNFFPAEEYHQNCLDKNPGGCCHIPREFFSLAERADTVL